VHRVELRLELTEALETFAYHVLILKQAHGKWKLLDDASSATVRARGDEFFLSQ
jgi:hypothetical protein